MPADVDCVVLGAGVVGLAVARELALAGREVLVAESAGAIGTGTSSRNSEVIHAGIYYPANSLKARLCVQGKHLLYAYCQERGIAHGRPGKLIVATSPEQALQLKSLAQQARQNGVDDLQWISGAQAQQLEPALSCTAALLSPSTGIIDSHGLMLALQGESENNNAQYVFHTPFIGGEILRNGLFRLRFGGAEPLELSAACVVNATGLSAPANAHKLAGQPTEHIPQAYLCKGSYFTLSGKSPFSRLIYPMPDHAGLGVHLTLDIGGQAKFGPDTEWVESEDYSLDPARAGAFYAAIRRYWPGLPDNALAPGYTGIRPKISAAGEPPADFAIAGPATHGVDSLINLFGIESPGLTASLAIARAVRQALAF
ncbi:NAD(P)/FAD-dependent oxidoreductase [Eoetvoesiella caeni]|uniref:L-2-hydroxyglutarate oxidase LhgO n=1 Tax=Eoetvoesiella caeni TaxID=645616 RepID=A0A366HAS7_9BURK|nr:NAD(P)/FAD-dependent oxidoreductase [Eoetvoesiella caeni]MCI2809281.1 NAD(P)/FAD-dependent oxidoreductase [Eoetvoesiella caeni]NYT54421.1 NAD(P)/FAD-dependent oxidoreductase [Eoetvoesiella caeni]RBP39391.1 L-2-hydroxyglutarate oxidase LhgO [Eoetvoesiella caeni]